jgi:hypothetical protein
MDIVGPKKYLEFCQLIDMDFESSFDERNFPALTDGFFRTHLQNSFHFEGKTKIAQLIVDFEGLNELWENIKNETQTLQKSLTKFVIPQEYQAHISNLVLASPLLL